MVERSIRDRTYSVSQASKVKAGAGKTSSTRSRVISDNSGYAAANFEFPNQDYPPSLIITEPNEDTSSWQ